MDSRKFNTLKGCILGGFFGFSATAITFRIYYINNFFYEHVGIKPYTNCYWKNDSFIPEFACSSLFTEYTLIYVANTEYRINLNSQIPYWVIGTVIGAYIGEYLYKTPTTQRPQQIKKRYADEWNELPLPENFIDPISMKLIRNPIITCTAQNEKITIYDYRTLTKLKGVCPYSRYDIIIVGFDYDLKKRINLFIEVLKKSKILCPKDDTSKKKFFFTFFKFRTTVNPAYICPITGYQMKDPVKASDGHTYEKKAILDRIYKQHNLFSPVKKDTMLEPMSANTWVIPNDELKQQISGVSVPKPQVIAAKLRS